MTSAKLQWRNSAAPRVVPERLEDEARAVRGGVGVALAMLGVADRAGLLVRRTDEDLHALVVLHDVERRPLALRLDRGAGLRLGAVDLPLLVWRGRVIGTRAWRLDRVGHRRNSITAEAIADECAERRGAVAPRPRFRCGRARSCA